MNYSPSSPQANATCTTMAHFEEALGQSSSSSSNGSSSHSTISHMVSQIPAMVYSWHIQNATGESSFSYVSVYCHNIFGISAEDAMANSNLIVNMMVEEDVPGFTAAIVQSMKELSLFDWQVRIKRPSDGERRTIHFQSRPRHETKRNEDGEEASVTVWDGVVTDVSRHTRHQSFNARQVESLVQEDTLIPRFSLDVAGKILEWNRLMVKTTGHTRDAVLGKPIEEFVFAPDIPAFSAHVKGALKDSRYAPLASGAPKISPERGFSFLAADGTNRQLRTQCKVTFDLNDEISGLVWACQDMTLLHEAHQEKDAATKLMRAERGLTEWLSHEMRNPLSVAMEALQTVQELTAPQVAFAEDGYSTAECYQVMEESMNYVVDLLNNVMDLDQCAQGIVPVVSAPCNAKNDILLPTYRMMKRVKRSGAVTLRLAPCLAALITPELSSRDILADNEDQSEARDISRTPSLEDVVAHVDKLRLRQVLTNLIANAFHFTSTGFVEIDMHIREGASASQTLSFHVRDSGCGVQPSEYNALFSRWEQLGSSRNGTGIGLCLCQALIQAMGGSIWLNTKYNSGFEGQPGAEFIVELPIDAPQVSSTGDDIGGFAQQGVQSELPASSLSSAIMASKSILPNYSGTIRCGPVALTQSSNSNSYPREFNHLKTPGKISRRASLGDTLANSLQHQMSLGAATAAAQNAAVFSPFATYSPALITRNSFIRGHYRILIVDDEKMGRKFLKRRFSRLFPGAHMKEVASGEEALVEASNQQFDIITMDHFMAINELNGDQTIRKLRKVHVDAAIIGISGNKKEKEHLEAGADMFFQKPLPNDKVLLESFRGKLPPPKGWNVLVVSNDSSISTLLTDRLYRVASPHYTSHKEAVKRWSIATVPFVSSIKEIDGFDLVVMVQSTGASQATPDIVRQHLRGLARDQELVLADCFDIIHPMANDDDKSLGPSWSKTPLPSVEMMRRSLCQALFSEREASKTVSRTSSDETKTASCSPVRPVRNAPRRSGSGVAKSA